MSWIGLDIGGANLKAASSNRIAISQPFPMWTDWQRLDSAIVQLLQRMSEVDKGSITGIAVVMTGELADCFQSKAQGVQHIVESIVKSAKAIDVDQVVFYSLDRQWLPAEMAIENWSMVAAANWFALAEFVAVGLAKNETHNDAGQVILIDVGSTTVDILPLARGKCVAKGRTDTERLATGELVYLGVDRTPISMLITEFELPERVVGVAREQFATIKDALIVSRLRAESPNDHATADGRSATLACCRQRLARSVCADPDELREGEIERIASETVNAAGSLIEKAITKVTSAVEIQEKDPALVFVLSGEGEWFVQPIVERMFSDSKLVSIAEVVSPEVCRSAPAYAVACLANAEFGND